MKCLGPFAPGILFLEGDMMILNEEEINIVENNQVFKYELLLTSDDDPVYKPTDDLIFEEGVNTDSFLIIPIFYKSWKRPNPKSSYSIYRIRFDSRRQITTSLVFGPDPNGLSWSEIEIKTSVRKLVVSIGKDRNIYVQREFDPLYPPMISEFNAPSSMIGKIVLENIKYQLDGFAAYYLRHIVT